MSVIDQTVTDQFALYRGDCVEVLADIPSDTMHYTIFSPPFASLYTYSDDPRDMGNVKDHAEFFEQYDYLAEQLYRVTMPGRLVSVHSMLMPTSKTKDGYIGMYDFRGDIVRSMEKHGWIFHSEVVIWKDPVTQMQRTKALGLLHKQVKKDSCMSRQGAADYLSTFRKPGDNPERVTHTGEEDDMPVTLWQQYASPVWMDINPSDTLQYRSARENEDERHICVARDSLVCTFDGYLPIQDVKEGQWVLSHKGKWRRVIAKKMTNAAADVVQVKAHGVPNLRVTPDHQMWARLGATSHPKPYAMKQCPTWVGAIETVGSYVHLPSTPVAPVSISDSELWMIGRWLGDGHRDTRGGLHISCSYDELDDLTNRLGQLGGMTHDTGTAMQVRLNKTNISPAAWSVLSRCGHGASAKVVPGELLSLPSAQAEQVIDGYLTADGHRVESLSRWTASSVSRGLVLGMAMVAQRARGSVASCYQGREGGESMIGERTVSTLTEWILSIPDRNGSAWLDNDGGWKKVRSVDEYGQSEVWDLQIEVDSSFVVEGCAVHNCPLQLEVIRRGITLWSNPGDTVLSPFAGIGSEGHVALEMGRRFVGCELKQSYYEQAKRNLAAAGRQESLFAVGAK